MTACASVISVELVGLPLLLGLAGSLDEFSLSVVTLLSGCSATCLAASRILWKNPVICEKKGQTKLRISETNISDLPKLN